MAYQIDNMAHQGSTVGGAPKAKPVTVVSAIEAFDPVIVRLETLCSRVATCANRIAGPVPNEVHDGDPDPTPNNVIAAAKARYDRACRVVADLEAEFARIENGIS